MQATSNLRFVLMHARADRYTVMMFDSQPRMTKRGKRLLLATTKGKGVAVTRMIALKAQGAKLKPEIITYKAVIDASAKSTVLLSMHGDDCRVVIRWHFKT